MLGDIRQRQRNNALAFRRHHAHHAWPAGEQIDRLVVNGKGNGGALVIGNLDVPRLFRRIQWQRQGAQARGHELGVAHTARREPLQQVRKQQRSCHFEAQWPGHGIETDQRHAGIAT